MKRMLLVLALAGGVMGCDATWRSQESQGPAINPLTLLDQSLGMREAVCQYGLQTQQFKDYEECEKFWKWKDIDMESAIRDYNDRYKSSRTFPGSQYMKYGVMPDGITLMMYYGGDRPEWAISQSIGIMRRGKIAWRKRG